MKANQFRILRKDTPTSYLVEADEYFESDEFVKFYKQTPNGPNPKLFIHAVSKEYVISFTFLEEGEV